ncbi:hypothetical protein LCGC14_1224520 [marine sediment metagenome]|uniref:Response regulatory domain-containing protein n=1 Tax=marine sediment metagenome TaxID=412755 RepID=A0A0F9LED5_9ZZZZ
MVISISDNSKKTKKMEDYENETGKFAIWRGRVTEGFKKWQKGEKIYEKDKERIMILVSDEVKSKWQNFVKKFEYTTVSKLIREAVNTFIKLKESNSSRKPLPQISHELKESLTIIKGYSHLLFEEYKEQLDWEVISKIKTIYDQSLILEDKIIDNLEQPKVEKFSYDILIIDDELLTINLLVDYFEMKNYTCKYFLTGTEALEEMKYSTPKLILLDILLPDIDGFEICKKIKSNENLKKVPVFYITAVPHSEVVGKMSETGADGYFLKPFDFSKFKILFDYL